MVKIQSHNDANELISLSGAYLELNESENNLPIGPGLQARQESSLLRIRIAAAVEYFGAR